MQTEYSAVREACKEMGDPDSDCKAPQPVAAWLRGTCPGLATSTACRPSPCASASTTLPHCPALLHLVPPNPRSPADVRPPLADAPPITFVVVQKRHHTRFFPLPQDQQNRDRSGNILPGGFPPASKSTRPQHQQQQHGS